GQVLEGIGAGCQGQQGQTTYRARPLCAKGADNQFASHASCSVARPDGLRGKFPPVSPEEIKQLRKELKLTARQLADAIKAEAEDVWAWESGERFPTKRHVTRMVALQKKGAAPAPKRDVPAGGLDKLADPNLWLLVRKLVGH